MAKDLTKDLTKEQLLKAWELYESHWQHREKTMWKVMFTLFYAILICNGLPFFKNKFNFSGIAWLFPLIGFVWTYCFRVITLSHGARLEATAKTIDRIRKKLGPICKKVSIEETSFKGSFFAMRHMAKWIPIAMFWALIGVSFAALNVAVRGVWNMNRIIWVNVAVAHVTLLWAFITRTKVEKKEKAPLKVEVRIVD